MFDIIVVGTGAAGVAAAFGFTERGIKPLILDVGFSNPDQDVKVSQNLYDFKQERDSFDLTIGKDYRGLHNIAYPDNTVPVKLTAPNFGFVTQGSEQLSPYRSGGFSPVQSFASGGLANAWGAGVYRFIERDLEGFPLKEPDLVGYFDRLTDEIGISGTEDDLRPFFGKADRLQEPLRLSFNASLLYQAYQKNREYLNLKGLHVGRARLAVLSEARDGRHPCDYTNLEFWQPGLPYIYTPLITLEKLVREGKVYYKNQRLVNSFEEIDGGVLVRCKNLPNQIDEEFRCKKLLLAAGAINTAKIVLSSRQDFETQLSLLDNPAIQIPLVFPSSIGRVIDKHAFGLVQLNLVWEDNHTGERLQGSVMEITSPMRAEFFPSLPFCASANLDLMRYLLPAMMLIQLFYPSSMRKPSRLKLLPDNSLSIEGDEISVDLSHVKTFLGFMRRLGAYSHPALIVKVPNGHAIHYAGTLPMRDIPSTPYECYPNGRLNQTENVYIVDGASFPALPAKNYSFAMMANAMRIADEIAKRTGDV